MPPINTFTKTALTFAVGQALMTSSHAATIEVNTTQDAINPSDVADVDENNNGIPDAAETAEFNVAPVLLLLLDEE